MLAHTWLVLGVRGAKDWHRACCACQNLSKHSAEGWHLPLIRQDGRGPRASANNKAPPVVMDHLWHAWPHGGRHGQWHAADETGADKARAGWESWRAGENGMDCGTRGNGESKPAKTQFSCFQTAVEQNCARGLFLLMYLHCLVFFSKAAKLRSW